MERVATRRLIDASASLGPADRALLNLWVNRGLDVPTLGRLTGLDPAALAQRRERIISELSDRLGLPPQDIGEALAQIAASNAQPPPGDVPASSNGGPHAPASNADAPAADTDAPAADTDAPAADTEPPEQSAVPMAGLNGHTPGDVVVAGLGESAQPPTANPPTANPPTADPPTTEADTGPRAEPVPATKSRPRRGWLVALIGLPALVVIGLVLVLVLSSSSGAGTHRPAPVVPKVTKVTTATTGAAASSTTPAAPAAPAGPGTSPTVSRPPIQSLAALPGGTAHATGSVFLLGKGPKLKLRLKVRGLPAARAGHYEVWLYNSIVDSVALGRLRTGVHELVLRLPRRVRHFHWIDVSFQPSGTVYPSGESVLRAANPARATRKQLLHRRSARRRQLRRTTSGSTKANRSK